MSVPPPMNVVTTDPDERSMAALAHASILLSFFVPGLGIIAAAAVWLTQRERSPYTANQALQATVYQIALTLVPIILGVVVVVIAVFGVIMAVAFESGISLAVLPFALLALLGVVVFWVLGLLYALVAAYETYQGRDFRYWIIGNLVERR